MDVELKRPPLAARIIIRAAAIWAAAGGVVICIVAIYTAASNISSITTGRAYTPEHEVVMHLTAIAVFAFLPYCHISNSNITVDLLYVHWRERTRGLAELFASLLILAGAVVLLRQMAMGMQSYRAYMEITPVLRIPIWYAFPFVLVSLVLLTLTALLSAYGSARIALGRARWDYGLETGEQ